MTARRPLLTSIIPLLARPIPESFIPSPRVLVTHNPDTLTTPTSAHLTSAKGTP